MRTRTVLLDALGTLVELVPPWPELARRLGGSVEPDRIAVAFRDEMAYYREHSHEGRDRESLAALRAHCAGLLSERLGVEVGVEAMMGSIAFRAYDEVPDALRALRDRGLGLFVVSNWDFELPDVLERTGLAPLLDGVLTSAGTGIRKPDPGIFERALELAGCSADEAIHVGDSPRDDVEGATAAGIRPVLIDREGGGDIDSLQAVEGLL